MQLPATEPEVRPVVLLLWVVEVVAVAEVVTRAKAMKSEWVVAL